MFKFDKQRKLIVVADLVNCNFTVSCDTEENDNTLPRCIHCHQPIGHAVTRCPYCGEEN